MKFIRRLWTRLFGGLYSRIANNLYEPVIVKVAFPLFGRDLPALVLEQGRKAVASSGGGPILDLPIGTGYFTTHIACAHTGLTVGADLAWGMVKRSKRAATESRASRLSLVQADGFALPFRDEAFAAIVSSNGLQVMPDLAGAVNELFRVTAPGAVVYVALPTIPIGALLPGFLSRRIPTFFRSGRDVAGAMRDAGFEIVMVRRSRLAYLVEGRRPNGS